jgi:hypothetical protein
MYPSQMGAGFVLVSIILVVLNVCVHMLAIVEVLYLGYHGPPVTTQKNWARLNSL